MAVMCLICSRMFSNQTNVNKHMKNIHNKHSKAVEYEASMGTYKCLEGFETSFKFNNDLRDHLRIKHGLSQDVVTKSFTSYNDFMSWLKIEEAQNNARYFRDTGIKKLGGGSLHANSKIYFDCARSGKLSKGVIISSKGKKTQGSCKLNRYCISQIIVTVKEDSCVMKYFKNHYGHIHELQHVRLSKQKREVTAAKLILGISSECILDSTRDNIGKSLNRDDLLTNKDINNIKQSFNIQLRSSGYRHKDDPISVDLWIEEVKESEYNPVLYYKKQNHSCQRYNLSPQDFILILMTKTQRDLMKKFGTTVICVDTTHGLNAYNFELRTILTIDEYGSAENNYIYNVIVKEDNYIVTKKQSSPCCNLKCSYCDICIHSYECTGVDYNLKLTICKHVRVLCLQKSTQPKEMPSVEDYKNKEIEQLVEGLQTMKQETNSIKTTKLEEDVISMAHQIIHKVKTNKMDADNLELIKKNLKVAVSVGSINCSLANQFVDKCGNLPEHTHANKKIEKQSYFSNKKGKEK